MLVLADGLHGAPHNLTGAAEAWRTLLPLTNGWADGGRDAAERTAAGDARGAALRYAALAEQGCPSSALNLAWLLHRGAVHADPDRHSLAQELWQRAAALGEVEGMLMAGHQLLDGGRLGLDGGALPAAG